MEAKAKSLGSPSEKKVTAKEIEMRKDLEKAQKVFTNLRKRGVEIVYPTR